MQRSTYLHLISMTVACIVFATPITAIGKAGAYNPATFKPSAGSASETASAPNLAGIYTSNLAKDGVTFSFTNNTLAITMDMASVVAALDDLQQLGVVPSVDDDAMINAPNKTIIKTVGYSLALNILQFTYQQNKTADKIQVHVFIKPVNSQNLQSCFSFNSTLTWIRNLDDENSITNNIQSAPQYMMDSWCVGALNTKLR